MPIQFLRPKPFIPIAAELLEPGMSNVIDEAIPAILGEADVWSSSHIIDLGLVAVQGCLLDGLPFLTTHYDNGMVEIFPVDVEEPGSMGNITNVDTGRPTDSIIYLPQLAETWVVVTDNKDETGKLIRGLITVREGECLYEPHFLAICHLTPRQA